ncbi:MAG: glucose 1-dehydrogenase [Chloroflexi bacterium]|jgi:glucose 1-dehydrogenase|nr:MAG: glucose 1-dehydrogenase [Chloroflexota bacterium]
MGKLDGKVAVVVGGGRNIGRAISLLFAKEGAKIAIFDMDEGRAAGVAEEVEAQGGECTYVIGPVQDVNSVKNMVSTVVGRLGKIDILTNCAAISDRLPMLELPDEEYLRIVDVTMHGSYYTCKYVAEQMVKQGTGGAIVNFSSGSAFRGSTSRVAYDMAKGAIVTLTMDLAVQLGPHGIRANAIAPGITGSQVGGTIAMEDRSTRNVIGGRPGLPEEQASVALFLASDDAAHIHGQTINVDAGMNVM